VPDDDDPARIAVRDLEDLGQRVDRPPLEVMQDQDRPLLDGKLPYGHIERRSIGLRRAGRCRETVDARHAAGRDFAYAPASSGPVGHPGRIDGHTLQPGVKAVGVA
jgi:hypothetical protein